MGTPKNDLRSTFASTTGGVMTDKVGAITGDLELSTTLSEGRLQALVRYAGSEDWYAVAGGIVDAPNVPQHEAHERIVGHLSAPGRVVDGNEEAVSLHGFFSA